MLKKAYLEITDVCNLSCSFCHGTKRAARFMTEDEFSTAAKRLRPFADFLYFHLLGEPLLHPLLGRFFEIAQELGFKVIITTNGTLLSEKRDVLLSSPALHKISISLHSFEGSEGFDGYMESCLGFCDAAAQAGIICVLRLWDAGGALDGGFLSRIRQYFDFEWEEQRRGYKIKEKLFLEWGDHFDWPDIELPVISASHGCYGLRDQIGVLCDGTVVPCCLDAEGVIGLGNIFESDLKDILSSERAVDLKTQLQNGIIKEPLCLRCGFAATRFGK